MKKTHSGTINLLVTCGILLAAVFFFMPRGADAAQLTSRLGGGNALLRASIAQSLGLPLTSSAGNTGSNGNPIGNSASSNGGNNGGATAGNGGNGGNGGSASAGGLVRAGNVFSNSNASNSINVTVVRISIGR